MSYQTVNPYTAEVIEDFKQDTDAEVTARSRRLSNRDTKEEDEALDDSAAEEEDQELEEEDEVEAAAKANRN